MLLLLNLQKHNIMVNNFKYLLSPLRKRVIAKPPPAPGTSTIIGNENFLYDSL